MKTLLRGGLIVDGSGGEPYAGDVLIDRGVIVEVGPVPDAALSGAVCVDAAGCCVTPGFIDIHRHADYAAFADDFGGLELAQGITTLFTGACGLTPYPFAEALTDTLTPILGEAPFALPSFAAYKAALAQRPLPVNVGAMIGTCAIRASVKGLDPRPFTDAETETARAYARDAAAQGAAGVSLGLMYAPDCFSSVDELADMARGARVMAVHLRGEGDSLLPALREAIAVAQKADVPLHISHFKCCGARNWGKGIYEAIALIEQARAVMDVSVDFYPYEGGAGTILSLLPPGFPRALWGDAKAVKAALEKTYPGWDNYIAALGFGRIIVNGLRHSDYAGHNGQSVAAISERAGRDAYTVFSELLAGEAGRAGIIVMSMSPEDVDAVARLGYAHVISDALYAQPLSDAHPRLFAAFPKIIRDFVLARGVLTLPEAVRKMTALPAARVQLAGRGLLKPGYRADINVFRPEELRDRSDFAQSGLRAEGMKYVYVNGGLAYENGRPAGRYGKWIGVGG